MVPVISVEPAWRYSLFSVTVFPAHWRHSSRSISLAKQRSGPPWDVHADTKAHAYPSVRRPVCLFDLPVGLRKRLKGGTPELVLEAFVFLHGVYGLPSVKRHIQIAVRPRNALFLSESGTFSNLSELNDSFQRPNRRSVLSCSPLTACSLFSLLFLPCFPLPSSLAVHPNLPLHLANAVMASKGRVQGESWLLLLLSPPHFNPLSSVMSPATPK